MGKLNSTVVPRPSRLATSMVPPCSCMMVCEIDSPSPVPRGLVEKNGLNSLASTPRDMPTPVSLTRTCWYWTHDEAPRRGFFPAVSPVRRPGLRGPWRRRMLRTS